MKVLLIQDNGRHEENRYFRETWVLKKAFEKKGHETTLWGRYHDNFNIVPNFNSFDIILNLENYSDDWLPDLSKYTKPYKMFYAMDSHVRGMAPYEKIFKDGKYNLLLCGIKIHSSGEDKVWWPLGISCDPELFYKDKNIKKNHYLGFVGNYVTGERQNIINFLHQKHNLQQNIFVIGKKMVELINSFNIHFNYNISNSCNARNFETIMCGTCLLTNNNCEYEDLGFKHQENCLIYNNVNELEDIINIYKNNLNEIELIAARGMELSKKHCADKRVESLLKYIQNKI
ncbi:MAG: glycosyltransferase family 1 protein [Proteobacteria bacterium]|nr:glycosyltransferase family 1 protein [Pseudomonadota bacterium]NBP14791.1 glycosyltransferase family 1 protein [bacterium]